MKVRNKRISLTLKNYGKRSEAPAVAANEFDQMILTAFEPFKVPASILKVIQGPSNEDQNSLLSKLFFVQRWKEKSRVEAMADWIMEQDSEASELLRKVKGLIKQLEQKPETDQVFNTLVYLDAVVVRARYKLRRRFFIKATSVLSGGLVFLGPVAVWGRKVALADLNAPIAKACVKAGNVPAAVFAQAEYEANKELLKSAAAKGLGVPEKAVLVQVMEAQQTVEAEMIAQAGSTAVSNILGAIETPGMGEGMPWSDFENLVKESVGEYLGGIADERGNAYQVWNAMDQSFDVLADKIRVILDSGQKVDWEQIEALKHIQRELMKVMRVHLPKCPEEAADPDTAMQRYKRRRKQIQWDIEHHPEYDEVLFARLYEVMMNRANSTNASEAETWEGYIGHYKAKLGIEEGI